jgi:hypothetical protein
MHTSIKKAAATTAGFALALGAGLGLGVAGAAPAQAAGAYGNCPAGPFCAWKTDGATGTMLKINKDVPDLGAYGFDNKIRAYSNRTALIACLYSEKNYAYQTYWAAKPDAHGAGSSGPAEADKSSVKFVRTERECVLPGHPDWRAEFRPYSASAFGDLNHDRRADVLSRDTAGRLWFASGAGGGRIVGSGGWNGMNALTRHGDVDHDGREDLIAREAATGKLWLYPGRGDGSFGARRLIGSGGWNGMSGITAFGDLAGDSGSDVIAVEKSTGKLWLYPGRSGAAMTERRLIGTGGWNGMDALVAAGDVDQDGHPDLYAREAATGKLWFYPGRSSGLGARTPLGAGWNAMAAVLSVGDTTGDGKPDLSTVTNSQYKINGSAGHAGWLVSYPGRGNGLLEPGRLAHGEWWGLNGVF